MMTPFTAAIVALSTAMCATPLARAIGWQLRLIDVPNSRSSHSTATPRSGGVAIIGAIALATAIAGVFRDRSLAAIGLATGALVLLALVDELHGLPRLLRLFAQAMITLILVACSGIHVSTLAVPIAGVIPLGVLAVPVTILLVVWIINAYNFMDGIDGVAALEALICGVTMALLFVRRADLPGALAAGAISGAAAGFLPWNFPKASIFMGDIGSTTFGFLFATLALRLGQDGLLIVGLLPLFPFLFDATVTLMWRIARGEAFFHPHKSHFYQRLVQRGYRHPFVTMVWGILALCASFLALKYEGLTETSRALALGALFAMHAAVAIFALQKKSQIAVSNGLS